MIILREALAQVFQDMDLLVVVIPGYLVMVLHQVVGWDYQDMVP